MSTPLIRVWAVNGMKSACALGMSRSRMPCFSLASTTIERPSGVSSAARRAAPRRPAPLADAGTGMNSVACRLPSVIVPVLSSSSVSTSPAASTARPVMASTLKRTSRSMPAMPIAESSPPIVVGIRQTSRATRTMTGPCRRRRRRTAREGRDGDQEDDRQPGEQDVERDLVRRLLPLRALDQGDHPVEERLAGVRGDAHDDPVGDDLGAAGDRRAVAAALADDRRRLAGDRRLVDGGDALDHLAVARDDLAGLDQHEVAGFSAERRRRLELCPVAARPLAPSSVRVLRSVSAWALPRPSAIASAKLANRTVNQSQRVIWREPAEGAPADRGRDEQDRGQHGADLDDEHHRVLGQRAADRACEGVADRRHDDLRVVSS